MGSPLTCPVTLSKVICVLVFRDDIAASTAYNGDAFTRDTVVKLIAGRPAAQLHQDGGIFRLN